MLPLFIFLWCLQFLLLSAILVYFGLQNRDILILLLLFCLLVGIIYEKLLYIHYLNTQCFNLQQTHIQVSSTCCQIFGKLFILFLLYFSHLDMGVTFPNWWAAQGQDGSHRPMFRTPSTMPPSHPLKSIAFPGDQQRGTNVPLKISGLVSNLTLQSAEKKLSFPRLQKVFHFAAILNGFKSFQV